MVKKSLLSFLFALFLGYVQQLCAQIPVSQGIPSTCNLSKNQYFAVAKPAMSQQMKARGFPGEPTNEQVLCILNTPAPQRVAQLQAMISIMKSPAPVNPTPRNDQQTDGFPKSVSPSREEQRSPPVNTPEQLKPPAEISIGENGALFSQFNPNYPIIYTIRHPNIGQILLVFQSKNPPTSLLIKRCTLQYNSSDRGTRLPIYVVKDPNACEIQYPPAQNSQLGPRPSDSLGGSTPQQTPAANSQSEPPPYVSPGGSAPQQTNEMNASLPQEIKGWTIIPTRHVPGSQIAETNYQNNTKILIKFDNPGNYNTPHLVCLNPGDCVLKKELGSPNAYTVSGSHTWYPGQITFNTEELPLSRSDNNIPLFNTVHKGINFLISYQGNASQISSLNKPILKCAYGQTCTFTFAKIVSQGALMPVYNVSGSHSVYDAQPKTYVMPTGPLAPPNSTSQGITSEVKSESIPIPSTGIFLIRLAGTQQVSTNLPDGRSIQILLGDEDAKTINEKFNLNAAYSLPAPQIKLLCQENNCSFKKDQVNQIFVIQGKYAINFINPGVPNQTRSNLSEASSNITPKASSPLPFAPAPIKVPIYLSGNIMNKNNSSYTTIIHDGKSFDIFLPENEANRIKKLMSTLSVKQLKLECLEYNGCPLEKEQKKESYKINGRFTIIPYSYNIAEKYFLHEITPVTFSNMGQSNNKYYIRFNLLINDGSQQMVTFEEDSFSNFNWVQNFNSKNLRLECVSTYCLIYKKTTKDNTRSYTTYHADGKFNLK